MTLTSATIQAKVEILNAYVAQLAKKYSDKIKYGAGTKTDLRKLVFIQSLIEDVEDQATITDSDDEYCLTEDQINGYFEQLPDLIGGICVDIYGIDLDELLDEIAEAGEGNGLLLGDGSYILLGDGTILLLG